MKEFEIPRLDLFADELVHFEHATYFTPTFIAELKKEIPLAVEHAKRILIGIVSNQRNSTRQDLNEKSKGGNSRRITYLTRKMTQGRGRAAYGSGGDSDYVIHQSFLASP